MRRALALIPGLAFLVSGGFLHITGWSGGDCEINRNMDFLTVAGTLRLGWPISPIEQSMPETYFLCSGDFDVDGDMDIAAATSDWLAWYENMSGGSNWYFRWLGSSFEDVRMMAAADVNGDAQDDLVLTEDDGSIYWIDLQGGAPAQHVVSQYGGLCVFPCDIDGDGDVDIVGSSSTGTLSIYLNIHGSGGLMWSRTIVDTDIQGARSIVAEDYDLDGDLDLLVSADWGVYLYTCIDPVDTWVESHISSSEYADWHSLFTDVDEDGDLDIVGAGWDLMWFERDDTLWTSHQIDTTFTLQLVLEDFDGDGDTDICGLLREENETCFWERTTDDPPGWTSSRLVRGGTGDSWWVLRGLCSGDFQGDGLPDLATAGGVGSDLVWTSPGLGRANRGIWISEIIVVQWSPYYQSIDWTADSSMVSKLQFRVRASDDPDDLGPWSPPITQPGPLDPQPYGTYFQYMVEMESAGPALAPILHDLTVTWLSVGIEEERHEPSLPPPPLQLQSPCPNPCFGAAQIYFAISESRHVTISLFDTSGRLVSVPFDEEGEAGLNSTQVAGLEPGLYLVHARAGDLSRSARLVVVD